MKDTFPHGEGGIKQHNIKSLPLIMSNLMKRLKNISGFRKEKRRRIEVFQCSNKIFKRTILASIKKMNENIKLLNEKNERR